MTKLAWFLSPRFWLTTVALLWALNFLAGSTFDKWFDVPKNIELLEELSSLVQLAGRAGSLTDDVRFDNYSLIVKNQRIFLHSGEFHTFRLPVPSLWPDILQKVKAMGFNAISVYLHMGSLNPSRGVVDVQSYRALTPLYTAAMEAGIFIVLRPGPYINAETSAGGLAHWITSSVAGKWHFFTTLHDNIDSFVGELRTNASDYRDAWNDYILRVIDETAPWQVNLGGPVVAIQVDNEYSQDPPSHAGYFQQLIDVYRAPRAGKPDIVVPLTYNDPGLRKSFINGTGAVDLYGSDAYPQRYDCFNPSVWNPVPVGLHAYHMDANPSQPWYSPEFQGGAFDPWGPLSPGYDGCRELTGPQFENVFYQDLWASNAKLVNYYMARLNLTFSSGTSWGGIPFGGVYTSYDYGGAIKENRELTSKYDELKLQGMFIRSSPDFYPTDWVGNTSIVGIIPSSPAVLLTMLQNRAIDSSYFIARHLDSTSNVAANFTFNITTSLGQMSIPVELARRQSKVIVSDYRYGASSTSHSLTYSTASIFFAGVIDGRDVLVLYGDSSQNHQALLNLDQLPSNLVNGNIKLTPTTGKSVTTLLSVSPGNQGLTVVSSSDNQLVLFADNNTVKTLWAPVLETTSTKSNLFKSFFSIGTNESILVGGPYLVRSASLSSDKQTLSLKGDLNATAGDVELLVLAPKSVRTFQWNSKTIAVKGSSVSNPGLVQFTLKSPVPSISVPSLGPWKFFDSLPEIQSNFSDATWVVADHTTTNITRLPYYGDGRVLYGCDYGFCENTVIWRGHFNATGQEKSLNLSINGGEAFAASVWLNNVFLNSSYGNSTRNLQIREETDNEFMLPEAALRIGSDNVVTVVQVGSNILVATSNDPKSPRGIRGFQLKDAAGADIGSFGEWKVQGKIGGYVNFPDIHRGVMNEGGFFGERKGWHLPGFDTLHWTTRDLKSGLPSGGPGVGFFVTTFKLNFPKGFDVPLSFTFKDPTPGQPYRARLFVNGWNMGKRVANMGPQFKFPVHEGILDYQGINTVAIALWVMEPQVVSPDLSLVIDGVFSGGVDVVVDNPKWTAAGRENA
ncbi:glycoside hydrolase family 35 protein [Mycena floridula]|nr:glycoside hydrolase family 35 protein [Mycena floridula]